MAHAPLLAALLLAAAAAVQAGSAGSTSWSPWLGPGRVSHFGGTCPVGSFVRVSGRCSVVPCVAAVPEGVEGSAGHTAAQAGSRSVFAHMNSRHGGAWPADMECVDDVR